MNAYEIAKQIYEATDEQYMEIFTHLYKMMCAGETTEDTLTARDIRRVDVDELTSNLNDHLQDIRLYTEGMWWNEKPNAYDLAVRMYENTAWWDRDGVTVEDIEKDIAENPLDVIEHLMGIIEG